MVANEIKAEHLATAPDIWEGDRLDRKQDAAYLISFLTNKVAARKRRGEVGSYVVNLDARWGEGKTFFLDRLEKQIIQQDGLCCYVNAWRDDHAEDPLLAIMAEIDDVLKPLLPSSKPALKAWNMAKENGAAVVGKVATGIAKTLVKKYTGESFEALKEVSTNIAVLDEALDAGSDAASEQIKLLIDEGAEGLLASFKSQSKSITNFRTQLARTVRSLEEQKHGPFFVLVDELDRCKPSYAVKLLERIKHFFEVDNVVFIIATNTSQLQYSIEGTYGSGFDGLTYLKRFFDATYSFAKPSAKDFIRLHMQGIDQEKVRFPERSLEDFLVSSYEAFNPSFRTLLQWFDQIENVVNGWDSKIKIDLLLLIPIIDNFHRRGVADFTLNNTSSWVSRELHPFRKPQTHNTDYQKLNFVDLHREAIDGMQTPNAKMRNLMRDEFGMNPNKSYILDGLCQEYNDGIPEEAIKSVQLQLSRVVTLAGRMQNPAIS